MKIAIFGAGAIGCLVGSYLSKKNDVTLIGRPKLVENFKNNGIVIQGLTNNVYKNVKVLDTLSGEYDLLILTIKSFNTSDAMKLIYNKIKDAYLLSMQNGIDNIDIINRFKKDHLLAAVTTHGAYSLDYGNIVHTGTGLTRLGAISSDSEKFGVELASLFNDSGLKTEYSANIAADIWIKGAVNACINPVTAILNIKNGELISDRYLHSIVTELSRECTAVLESKGIKLELLGLVDQVIEDTAENYSSMVQDLRRGALTEIDHINGVFVEQGNMKNLALPYNNAVYDMVKYIEKIKKSY